jgi:PAS domain-containing protein
VSFEVSLAGSAVRIHTIPSADRAFAEHVERLRSGLPAATPATFEARLRRLYPRVVVRERALAGEPPAWYVYRDGAWMPSMAAAWWEAAGLPKVEFSLEGWFTDANPSALALLGIDGSDIASWHITDFVAPGALADTRTMFDIVGDGRDLTATVLLHPISAEPIAIDLRAERHGSTLTAVFRLADDVEVPVTAVVAPTPELVCLPEGDAAFRGYAELALARLRQPDPDSLAIRLHRLYPHARVEVDGARWVAMREPAGLETTPADWWQDPNLPRVEYDAQALIIEANEAAQRLLGSPLIGHFWQEFVTPGTTEQVTAMLEILSTMGAAESRFRMPSADGSLVEFDSYTTVDGERFVTVMRPTVQPRGQLS